MYVGDQNSDSYCNVAVPIYIMGLGRLYGSLSADCGTATTNLLTDASKILGLESEPSIAINPTDPQNLFVASIVSSNVATVYGAWSTNGGANWASYTNFSNSYSDPSVAFDAFGNLFVTYLTPDLSVPVLLSTNKGISFVTNTTYRAATLGTLDRPWLATGPGSVWLTCYSYAGQTSMVAGVSVTNLGGVGTWPAAPWGISNTAPTVAGNPGFGRGDIAVGPAGQVAVVMFSPTNALSGPCEIRLSTNLSGLSYPSNFSSARPIGYSHVGYQYKIPAQTGRGILPTPALAWDRSGGPYRGRLYMVYTDRLSTNTYDTDIYMTYSVNNGASWNAALKINTDSTTNSQFMPRIAVDQTSGKVAVSWYDCRADPNNTNTQFYAAVSSDGGVTFSSNNLQLETGQSNVPATGAAACQWPTGPGYYTTLGYGDYTGLAFYGGYFYPAWADNSNTVSGNPDCCSCGLEAYVARVKY